MTCSISAATLAYAAEALREPPLLRARKLFCWTTKKARSLPGVFMIRAARWPFAFAALPRRGVERALAEKAESRPRCGKACSMKGKFTGFRLFNGEGTACPA
ncbi:MAG: hypothetical protein U0401_19350 [Anaerolineae bacterium]